MKVLIVEDEKLSSDLLIRLLNKIDPSIMVVKVLDSVKKSIEVISNGLKADLLFLDIHLSDGNSFEILEKTNLEIPIIFTTAYNDYAIKAFKHNSMDLAIAIEKFKKFNHPQISDFSQHYKMLLGQLSSNFKTRFMVKSGLSISTIEIEHIHHFETIDSISFLVTNLGKKHAVNHSIDELSAILDPKIFFRINRKIFLHIQSAKKMSLYTNSRLFIESEYLKKEWAVVSRDRVTGFKQWLE